MYGKKRSKESALFEALLLINYRKSGPAISGKSIGVTKTIIAGAESPTRATVM